MTLWKQLPLLRILVFFMAGIVLHEATASFDIVLPKAKWVPGMLVLLLTAGRLLHQGLRSPLSGDLSFALFLVLLGYLFTLTLSTPLLKEPTETKLAGTLEEIKQNDSGWWQLTLRVDAAAPSSGAALLKGSRVLLTSSDSSLVDLQRGERLLLQTKLQALPFNTNPHAFDYGLFLRRKGYSSQAFLPAGSWKSLPLTPASHLALADAINRWCRDKLAQNKLEPEALALIQALLLGNRSELDREVNQNFVKSGAIHLLAVSGLHTGIIYILVASLLSLFIRSTHPLSVFLIISSLLAYAVVTGLAPSVVRAVLMLSLLQMGQLSRRPVNRYNLLCASALLQLLWRPLLIYHAGFWLSHLAVVGILAFYPLINNCCTLRFTPARKLWSLLAVSLAAQSTTLPLSLYLFGAFPSWFLLSNLLLLPLLTPILLLALASLALSFNPTLAALTAGPLNDLLLFMAQLTQSIEALPGSYPDNLWLSAPLLLLLYPLLFQVYRLCTRPRGTHWLQALALLCLLMAGFLAQQHIKLQNQTLVLYQTRKGLLLEGRSGGKVFALRSPKVSDADADFARSGLLRRSLLSKVHLKESLLPPDSLLHIQILAPKTQPILLYHGSSRTPLLIPDDTHIPTVLLNGNLRVDMPSLLKNESCRQVVAGPDCPPWLIREWTAALDSTKISFHSVRHKGAFVFP